MGVVSGNGNDEDAMWLRSLPPEERARFLYAGQIIPAEDHLTGVRVGILGMSMQCTTCGTICLARHEPMLLTDNETGATVTIPGAWVGPPDDAHRHFFPFRDSLPAPEPEAEPEAAPAPRPAGISTTAVARANDPEHRATIPSRTPDARRAERERAKRRNRTSAGRL